MKKSLFLLPIFIFILACGNSEKSNSEKMNTEDSTEEPKEQPSAKGVDVSPCELLSETEIKEALSIPADAETTMKEKSTTFPICMYEWKSITFPVKSVGDRIVDFPAELNIVLVKSANKKMYETSVSYYKDGQAESGVGDMATYSEKRNQITFLANGKLIHVNVRTTKDAASNKAKAINIAKMVIDKL